MWHLALKWAQAFIKTSGSESQPGKVELVTAHKIHGHKLESIQVQNFGNFQKQMIASYQKLTDCPVNGFPNHHHSVHELQTHQQLCIDDGIHTHSYSRRLVIPLQMHAKSIITVIHAAHQGSTCTKQRVAIPFGALARMDNLIDNMVYACKQCQDYLPSQPKDPIMFKPQSQ